MKKAVIALSQLPIRIYALFISPLCGPCCRYHPTCSAYAVEALEKHGVFKGLLLAASRILRCHPWGTRQGIDQVPEQFAWRNFMGYKRRRG